MIQNSRTSHTVQTYAWVASPKQQSPDIYCNTSAHMPLLLPQQWNCGSLLCMPTYQLTTNLEKPSQAIAQTPNQASCKQHVSRSIGHQSIPWTRGTHQHCLSACPLQYHTAIPTTRTMRMATALLRSCIPILDHRNTSLPPTDQWNVILYTVCYANLAGSHSGIEITQSAPTSKLLYTRGP